LYNNFEFSLELEYVYYVLFLKTLFPYFSILQRTSFEVS